MSPQGIQNMGAGFLCSSHAIYIHAEQLLKATKSVFVFLASMGSLKAPEK